MTKEDVIKHLQTYFQENLKGCSILDLGCGNMEFSVELIKEFSEIENLTAVDDDRSGRISSYYNTSIEDFQKNYKKRIINSWINSEGADLTKLKFIYSSLENFIQGENKKYDLIMLLNVYHFYSSLEERKKMMNYVVKAMKERGSLLIEVANELHPYKNDKDKSVFESSSLIAELKLLNLKLVGQSIEIDENLLALFEIDKVPG